MTIDARPWALALLAAMALAACDRRAQGNPDASGSPGAGNAREVTAPVVADTPPGGSSGMKGSLPYPGTSGSGTADGGGRSETAQMGAGTAGGLGGSSGLGMTGSFPAGSASGAGQPGHDQAGAAPAASSPR